MLQHSVQDLHVVGIPGVGQLIEDDQLHHGAQVVSVCVEQLSVKSVMKQHRLRASHGTDQSNYKHIKHWDATHLTHSM